MIREIRAESALARQTGGIASMECRSHVLVSPLQTESETIAQWIPSVFVFKIQQRDLQMYPQA